MCLGYLGHKGKSWSVRKRDLNMRILPNIWRRISASCMQALLENVRRGTPLSSFYEVSVIILILKSKIVQKIKL